MQYYAINPQVIHETIDGETIIIDLTTGIYFSLQGTAPAIWNGIAVGGATSRSLLVSRRSTRPIPPSSRPPSRPSSKSS